MMNQIAEQGRRLALLLPNLGGGGAERVALAMLQGFLDRGYEVDLVLAKRCGSLLQLVPKGVEIIDLDAPRLRQVLFPLTRYLRERRPYALHAMMWPMPLLAVLASAMARVGTRIIGSEHVVLSKTPMGLRNRLIRNLTRRAYLKADGLIVVSKGAAEDLSTFIGIPRNRIMVIHNPLLLPEDLPSIDVAAKYWKAGTKRVLAVGELKAEKNYPLLIRAMDFLCKNDPVSLLILGGGSLEGSLKQQVAAAGLEHCIIFAGFAHDVWPYYAAADVFVLSSDVEGFGNVLVEAMHAGVPIVSTDCPSGPREILAGGEFGALVPCDDPAALAEALRVTLSTAHDPEVLRRRARSLSGSELVDRHLAAMLGDDS
jgi:glycosyltransferase involved in cell wall biosynthesis